MMSGGVATVTLYRQDGVVQTFGYSPMFGVSLTVGRLTTVLDDIERRVVEHERMLRRCVRGSRGG